MIRKLEERKNSRLREVYSKNSERNRDSSESGEKMTNIRVKNKNQKYQKNCVSIMNVFHARP